MNNNKLLPIIKSPVYLPSWPSARRGRIRGALVRASRFLRFFLRLRRRRGIVLGPEPLDADLVAAGAAHVLQKGARRAAGDLDIGLVRENADRANVGAGHAALA